MSISLLDNTLNIPIETICGFHAEEGLIFVDVYATINVMNLGSMHNNQLFCVITKMLC